MPSEKGIAPASPINLAAALRRRRRAVLVKVLVRDREVDSFEVSQPQNLRAALRIVYAHLPTSGAEVRFEAVEEQWLPLGLRRSRRQADLAGLADALDFIAA